MKILTEKRSRTIVVFSVILVAFYLRIFHLGHHLHGGVFYSETNFIDKVLTDYFQDPYPKEHLPLYMIMVFIVTRIYYFIGLFFGRFSDFSGFLAGFRNDYSDVLLVNRAVVAVLGTITVLVFYKIIKKLFDSEWAAVIGALFFSICPLLVAESLKALLETPQVFFICLAFLYVSKIFIGEDGIKEYILCGIFIGLAATTKYVGALVIFPLLFAHFSKKKHSKKALFFTLGSLAAVICIVCLPVLSHWDRFFPSLSRTYSLLFDKTLARVYYPGGEAEKIGWLSFPLALPGAMGLGLLVLSLSGVLLAAIRRSQRDLLLFSFALPVFIFIGNIYRFSISYLMPLMPFLILFAVSGLEFLQARLRLKRFLFAAIFVLMLPSIFLTVHFTEWLSQKEISPIFFEWLKNNIGSESTVLHDSRQHLLGAKQFKCISLFDLNAESGDPQTFFRNNKIDYVVIDPGLPVAPRFRFFLNYVDKHFIKIKEFRPSIPGPGYNYYNLYGYFYNRPRIIYKIPSKN